MDLTPPALTRSPASPANTYCPSEHSLDYPSPILVGQHYKLALFHDTACSMAGLDSDASLPPLDALSSADWVSPGIMAPTSTSASIPNILSAEYDPFAHYDSPTPYGHESYPPPPSHSPAMAHSPLSSADLHSRSPAPPPSRGSAVYVQHAPRIKLEGVGDYHPAMGGGEVSHYPSPRSLHAPYGADPTAYATTAASSSPYMTDAHVSPFGGHDASADQLYHSPGSQGSSSFLDSRRRGVAGINRPRRPPRRLTTKEEANFQCEVKGCGKLFSRSYNFKAHMETHDEKREYPFPCTVADCGKKFVRKTDLQRHHQSVHAKERNHKCDYCSRLFARKDTLRRHMEDGCSKRFDIGTLDVRGGYDSMMGGRSMSSYSPPQGGLPPMAIAPTSNNGLLAPLPPSMRR